VLICAQCGAPLPPPGLGRFVACEYCGVHADVSRLIPPQPVPSLPVDADLPGESFIEPSPDEFQRSTPIRFIGAVIALVVMVVVVAVVVSTTLHPPAN
jgi:hypothetical protein